MTKKIVTPIVSLILIFFMYWWLLPTLSFGFWSSFSFWSLILILVAVNIGVIAADEGDFLFWPSIVAGILIIVVSIIAWVGGSALLSADRMYNQLGKAEEISFEQMIHEIDNSQIPIVDPDMAKKLADKKLGEDVALGSRVDLGELNLQEVNGEIMYVAPLEHSGFWKWQKNISTPGYITVSATNSSKVQFVTELDGKPIEIKYQPSAYMSYDLKRHIRSEGYRSFALTAMTFELDDSGNPYWVVTAYKNTTFWDNPEAVGVVVVDAQSGSTQFYSLDEIPEWVDLVHPESFIEDQIDNWGRYVHGFFNFSKMDEIKKTDLTLTVYMDNDCYHFTGMTSVGGDESCVGFIMVNTRNKQVKWCKMSGATESAAMKSAEGLVSDFGWKSTEPLPLNVNGIPTYVMALKDKEGLAKAYAMVNIENYSISIKGETLQEVSKNYIQKIAKSGTNAVVSSEEAFGYTLTGTVARISSVVQDGSTYYYLIINDDKSTVNMIFTGNYTISEELPITRAGDSVEIHYIDDNNGTADIIEFDNKMYGDGFIQISEDQENRNELDKDTSIIDNEDNNIVDVDSEKNEEQWNSLTDEEKAKLMEEFLKKEKE